MGAMSVFSSNRFVFFGILLFSISIIGVDLNAIDVGSLSDDAAYIKRWSDIFHLLKTNPKLRAQMTELEINQNAFELGEVLWDCPPFAESETVPTNVHSLRPGDVKILAALGDSITAGFGIRATTPARVLVPNRGESFSIGGDQSLDEGVITLTNIIRKFNPNVTGFSICARTREHKDSGFNVAVPGATNRGLEGQATELINKMLTWEGIDYHHDWKIITLFIGGNDLCRSCTAVGGEMFSPDAYRDGIKAALDLLHRHVPRAFVNLQAMLDISMVPDLTHPGQEELCDQLHRAECPCAVEERENNGTGTFNLTLRERQLEYFDKINELVTSGVYDNRSDFTVILQPHLRDYTVPQYANGSYVMDFIAPDCFHPSVLAHQTFAYMLWNLMLTPVESKPFKFDPEQYPKYLCPTEENPFFYTYKNSPVPTAAP